MYYSGGMKAEGSFCICFAQYYCLINSCIFFISIGVVKSTQEKRGALHLFRLGGAMLRIVRSKSRPLLHLMRCWNLVAPHLVEVRKMGAGEPCCSVGCIALKLLRATTACGWVACMLKGIVAPQERWCTTDCQSLTLKQMAKYHKKLDFCTILFPTF